MSVGWAIEKEKKKGLGSTGRNCTERGDRHRQNSTLKLYILPRKPRPQISIEVTIVGLLICQGKNMRDACDPALDELDGTMHSYLLHA